MKFWQKMFLVTLSIFLVGFGGLLISLLSRSERLNEQVIVQSAQSEMELIRSAIDTRLRGVAKNHSRFTAQALRMHLSVYADIYGSETAFFQISSETGDQYSSLPGVWVDVEDGESFLTWAGHLYFVQTDAFTVENTSLRLVLLKDVSALTDYRASMLWFGIAIYVALSLLFGGILLALALRLTRPIRALTKTVRDIAQGHLDERADVRQRDEIGELSASFNHMADVVQEQMRALEESNGQRQWFIDSLSHELRTPVTAIVGYGELLQRADVTPENEKKALGYIVEQGNRIQSLSEKLLDLARMQNGQMALEPVMLTEIVQRAAQSLEQVAQEKHVALSLEMESAVILGDEALLETLALNLLENAIRASSAGQVVKVRIWTRNGRAYFVIEDEGIGIAQEELSKITEPFYRVDPSRSRKNGGVGLGLTLCGQICRLHQATLSIDSALGRGCTVTVEFTTPQ